MDFSELVKKRESVRKYSSRIVEQDKIDMCIEAARLAPSACNSQPWKIIVVDDIALKEKIAGLTYDNIVKFNKFVHTAPAILVMVMERANLSSLIGTQLKNINYRLIDMGIAAEHICLQAAELGLGTCMLGWFNQCKIKKLLNIPKSKKVPLLISIGYPENSSTREKVRKSFEDIKSHLKY